MTKVNGKKIAQYTKNNEFVREYISISSAGRLTEVSKSNIQNALSNINKTAGGFIWKYVE